MYCLQASLTFSLQDWSQVVSRSTGWGDEGLRLREGRRSLAYAGLLFGREGVRASTEPSDFVSVMVDHLYNIIRVEGICHQTN